METIRICHLYGNLLNTYGDYGNLLMFQYLARTRGYAVTIDIVSLDEPLNENDYDFIFIGGGQDYEQRIIARDIVFKKDALKTFIEKGKVMLAICGGYQLLGEFYELANGDKIDGAGVLPHYTLNENVQRFIGDIVTKDNEFTFYGFENHQGCTYLGEGQRPLGLVEVGYGNNGVDKTEGAVYKNCIGTYFHGPFLVRNTNFAEYLIELVLTNRESS